MYAIIVLMALAANDSETVPNKAARDGNASNVERWINDLSAPQFGARQDATKNLYRAGQSVFPQLVAAADGSQRRETVTRCIEILKRHYKEGDSSTRRAAELALQQVENSKNKIASSRAHNILHPPPPTPVFNRFGGRVVIRRMAPIQRGIPARRALPQRLPAGGRFGGLPIGGVTRKARIVSGNKTISISQDRTGIQVEVTTRDANGKNTITKSSAKTPAELKLKHPEAYKLYERYMGAGVLLPPRFGGKQIPGGPVPALPAIPKPPGLERLEKATKRLQQLK